MLCKIAGLQVEVPETGDLFPRCREYLCEEEENADIIIRAELFGNQKLRAHLSENDCIYCITLLLKNQAYREFLPFFFTNGLTFSKNACILNLCRGHFGMKGELHI